MFKCRNCKTSTHYCGSCEQEMYLDEGFCSEKCMEEFIDDENLYDVAEAFIGTITKEQFWALKKIIDNYTILEYTIDDLIERRDKVDENKNN